MNHILIIMAMEAEAKPIINHLDLNPLGKLDDNLQSLAFSGKINETRITLVINGKDKRFGVDSIGTVPASIATFSAIKRFNPDLVISAGTCGAFKNKGSKIGDVYLSTVFKNHDRRISIPEFDKYGIGNYQSANFEHLIDEIGLKKAVVSSGNSLDMCDTDMDIINENESVVKEMEAAGIAWVAEQFSTPFVALKSVTDLVDGELEAHEEFLINLEKASKALKEKVIAFLELLTKKDIKEKLLV
ncbi:phosphorylase family protein [Aureibacter tunicatorum]|uniref:5'-methylthioadenosine nucleosidase n=1 Tax=Aureibacter tunicatorum TaxID=866807 RepID=A0AAE3XPJ0_9BACT|nr:hypothetical protein [Aureibacter tunicatorum]MDR6240232.1 5'-methylthioadenosine nucleosidase [Aureibacter tunicatorum]BDD05887.1 5'-methylthioadenosine/S-adenosylhomocysteine nucleosidase [Aureibacter tunicatorum]